MVPDETKRHKHDKKKRIINTTGLPFQTRRYVVQVGIFQLRNLGTLINERNLFYLRSGNLKNCRECENLT